MSDDEIEQEQIEMLTDGQCPKCHSDGVDYLGPDGESHAFYCSVCDTDWIFGESDDDAEIKIDFS